MFMMGYDTMLNYVFLLWKFYYKIKDIDIRQITKLITYILNHLKYFY